MNHESTFNISWETIFKILIAVIGIYTLYLVRDILLWFVFALVIAILFNTLIDFLERKRIPRLISCLVLYFGIFVLLGFFVYKTAPIFLSETKDFSQNLPQYLQKISPFFEKFGIEIFKSTQTLFESLANNFERAGKNILNALSFIFGSIGAVFFVISLAFFISLKRNFGERILEIFSPLKYKNYFSNLWQKSKQKVSGWFISRIIGMVFVGVVTLIILKILNVKYAFILGSMAGILDFIPIVGPIIAGIIITLFAAMNNLGQAIFVLIAFIIIQQIENTFLLPVISAKFIGLSPILILIALSIGSKLGGILGAILFIPIVGIVFEVLKDYLIKIRREE